MTRRMLAALGVAAVVSFGACGGHGPSRTWSVRVEDDWPACWRVSAQVVCGPASWAPRSADYVNGGK